MKTVTIGRTNTGNFGVNTDIKFNDGKKLSEFSLQNTSRRGGGYNEIYSLPLKYVEEIAAFNKANPSSYTSFDVKENEFRKLFTKPGVMSVNMFD